VSRAYTLENAEDAFLEHLDRLMNEAGQDSYLIVEAGDVYVQFTPGREGKGVYCEAVSNEFLPPARQLTEEQIARLEELGFEPPNGTPNFSRSHAAAGPEDLRDLARLMLTVLSEVYGCDPRAMVKFNLTFQ
jgi:hypothetical protein